MIIDQPGVPAYEMTYNYLSKGGRVGDEGGDHFVMTVIDKDVHRLLPKPCLNL